MNNSKSQKTAPINSTKKIDSSVTVEKIRLSIYDNLMKRLFFICDICEGALVPTATCTVCKKTVSRKCGGCGVEISTPHAVSKSELRRNQCLAEVKLQ